MVPAGVERGWGRVDGCKIARIEGEARIGRVVQRRLLQSGLYLRKATFREMEWKEERRGERPALLGRYVRQKRRRLPACLRHLTWVLYRGGVGLSWWCGCSRDARPTPVSTSHPNNRAPPSTTPAICYLPAGALRPPLSLSFHPQKSLAWTYAASTQYSRLTARTWRPNAGRRPPPSLPRKIP